MEPFSSLPDFFRVPRSDSVQRASSDPESERFARDNMQRQAAPPWCAGSASRLRVLVRAISLFEAFEQYGNEGCFVRGHGQAPIYRTVVAALAGRARTRRYPLGVPYCGGRS